jgi:hypothetical protein
MSMLCTIPFSMYCTIGLAHVDVNAVHKSLFNALHNRLSTCWCQWHICTNLEKGEVYSLPPPRKINVDWCQQSEPSIWGTNERWMRFTSHRYTNSSTHLNFDVISTRTKYFGDGTHLHCVEFQNTICCQGAVIPSVWPALKQQNGVVMAIKSLQCYEKFRGSCYPMYLDSSFYCNSFSLLLGQSWIFEIWLGNMVSLPSKREIIDKFL